MNHWTQVCLILKPILFIPHHIATENFNPKQFNAFLAEVRKSKSQLKTQKGKITPASVW